MNPSGTLYLLPGFLGEETDQDVLCGFEKQLIQQLKCYLVENERTARRFLRKAGFTGNFDDIVLHLLDKDVSMKEQLLLLQILKNGTDVGMLSEAGAPALADPGAGFISLAHQAGIQVLPVPGPSAIMLAIIGSGLNGQQFSFNGYLPIEKTERLKKIVQLEELSFKTGYAQYFIETPYRNKAMLDDLFKACHQDTKICLAANLTQPGGWIKTMQKQYWEKNIPELHKIPVVYGLLRSQ